MSAELAATPGQTIGPFFGFSLPYDGGPELVPGHHRAAISLSGRVLDGAGNPVPDALLEIWQTAADGSVPVGGGSLHRDGQTFTGWGRAATDALGRYSFMTTRPGVISEGSVPFIALTVFARGLLDRLLTRIYLPTSDDAVARDPLLASLPEDRRATLLAEPVDDGYVFDVVLQGPGETVFLTYPATRP